MSNTLEKLIVRAEQRGVANLNGRMRDRDWVGPLREKWHIEIDNNILTFRHWGTETLKADLTTKKVLEYYGQSNSDRDSLNYVASHFRLPCSFRYRPSIDEFSMTERVVEQVQS